METLGDILKNLGFEEDENGRISIDKNAEILNAYPRLLEDDGMGYGVNEQYVVESDKEVYEATVDCVGTVEKDAEIDVNGEVKTIPIIDRYKLTPEKIRVFNLFRSKPSNKKHVSLLNKYLNGSEEENEE